MVRYGNLLLTLLFSTVVISLIFDPGIHGGPSGISVIPNYYLTNVSFETRRWWEVIYEPDEFYFIDEFPPFLSVQFDLEAGSVRLHTSMNTGKDYMALRVHPNTSFFYIPEYPYFSFDLRFPFISYMRAEYGEHAITVGRAKPKLGHWRYPLALSGVYPYLDSLIYNLNLGGIEYNFMLASINPILTKEEWEIQRSLRPINADPTSPYHTRTKNLVLHGFEFQLSDALVISVHELTMVGGKCLDLCSIDPMALLHNNFNEGYTNSMADFAMSWSLTDSWETYLEFVLDDYAVPIAEPEDVKPTAYGFTFGVIGRTKNWRIELSYVYTSRWLYNTFLPYLKFNARYMFLSNFPIPSRVIVDYPLGFEYGPDSQLFGLNLEIFNPIKIGIDAAYLLKGPATIETVYKEELPDTSEGHFLLRIGLEIGNLKLLLKSVDEKFMVGGSYEVVLSW